MRRGAACAAIAIAAHALIAVVVVGLIRASAVKTLEQRGSELHAAALQSIRAALPEFRVATLRRVTVELDAGERGYGESLLALDAVDVLATPDRVLDVDRARATYAELLAAIRARLAAGEPVKRAIVAELEARGLAAYSRPNDRLASALVGGGGSCQARSQLIAALIADLGFSEHAAVRAFKNHMAPVLGEGLSEWRFGQVSSCSGLGVRVPVRQLFDAYARGIASGRGGAFVYPESSDSCDDAGLVYDGQGLPDADPAPSLKATETPRALAFCPDARRLSVWRRELELVGASGAARLTRIETGEAELTAKSEGVLCHERRARELRLANAAPWQLLPVLAGLVGYYDEAALVFAAAGRLAITRDLEGRRREAYRQARKLVESVSWDAADGARELDALGAEGGEQLIALGSLGEQLMLRIVRGRRADRVLAQLISDPDTRERALTVFRELDPIARAETIGELDLVDGTLAADGPRARELAQLIAVRQCRARAARAWQSCRIESLEALVERERRRAGIAPEFQAPLVAEIARDALFSSPERSCQARELAGDVARWASGKPRAIAELALSGINVARQR